MIVILQKDEMTAAIGRVDIADPTLTELAGVVGVYDARQGAAVREGFRTERETNDGFKKALQTSRARGWETIYRGEQLNNPVFS